MTHNLKTIVPVLALTATLSACGMFGKDKPKAQAATPAPVAQQPAAPQQVQQQAPQVQLPKTVEVTSLDSTKEVAYKCGAAKAKQPLTVMYGIKGGQVVAAQVKYQNKLSPNLFRVIGADDRNIFAGNGITWVADKANPANLDKVNGNMLTQEAIETVNGKQHQVSQIVTRFCVIDKAATAKLNKKAKK